MDFFGIIISLLLLIFLVYRGVSVLVVAPLMAMLAVLFSGDMPMISAWTGPLMSATAAFIAEYFPVFLVGAIFGILMNSSGAARAIAIWISKTLGEKRTGAAVIIASFLLVYGGVSVFVVIFAMLPIANNIFIHNKLPKRLIPATILAGAMPAYAAPGAAQFINTIPIPILNTTIYSGFISGSIATLIWIIFSILYINKQFKIHGGKSELVEASTDKQELQQKLPSTFMAFLPIILVIVGNFIFTFLFLNQSVIEYYAPYGGIKGIWAITISLSFTIVAMLIIFRRYLKNAIIDITRGAVDSLLPIFNTGIQVGYGGVIRQLSAFSAIKIVLLSLSGPKLLTIACIAAVCGGIVGSASGGTGIVMEVFGADILAIAQEYHISHDVLHRVIIFGANITGTLPHSGLIITVLGVCGFTHKQSYKQIFIVSVFFPLIATLALIAMMYLGLS